VDDFIFTYTSAGEPMARVPKVARETILFGTRRTVEIKQVFVKIFYFHTPFTRNKTIRHFEFSAYISCDSVLVSKSYEAL